MLSIGLTLSVETASSSTNLEPINRLYRIHGAKYQRADSGPKWKLPVSDVDPRTMWSYLTTLGLLLVSKCQFLS